MGQKIFLSYSRVDGEKFATRLAHSLREAGCDVWIDQINIRPGKLWDVEVEKALETSTCVLFVATMQSTNSNNVLNEVYYALEENKEVIPVIFDNCRMPLRLKRLQNIDFRSDYDFAYSRLLTTLRSGPQQETIIKDSSITEKKDEKQSFNKDQEVFKKTPENNESDEEVRKESSSSLTSTNVFKEPDIVRADGGNLRKWIGWSIAMGVAIALLIIFYQISRDNKHKSTTGKEVTDTLSRTNNNQIVKADIKDTIAKSGAIVKDTGIKKPRTSSGFYTGPPAMNPGSRTETFKNMISGVKTTYVCDNETVKEVENDPWNDGYIPSDTHRTGSTDYARITFMFDDNQMSLLETTSDTKNSFPIKSKVYGTNIKNQVIKKYIIIAPAGNEVKIIISPEEKKLIQFIGYPRGGGQLNQYHILSINVN